MSPNISLFGMYYTSWGGVPGMVLVSLTATAGVVVSWVYFAELFRRLIELVGAFFESLGWIWSFQHPSSYK